MALLISKPNSIKKQHLKQIISLIKAGGEVKTTQKDLEKYLLKADLIAFKVIEGKVICTATLKNPFNSYRAKVFNAANSKTKNNYEKELGYIVTHPDFEGKGYCTTLLAQLIQHSAQKSIYATTRKAAMVHILGKFNFFRIGEVYNEDLKLLVYDGAKAYKEITN